MIEPVSYTHLDVYKRQLPEPGCSSPTRATSSTAMPRCRTTVSYTHLDVYKRQDVQSVKFNFEGSDVDPIYGLNTPAYLCIDDVTIE